MIWLIQSQVTLKAIGTGYVGFEDGAFRPGNTVHRAQAAAFIAKAKNLTQDTAQANSFSDSAAIAGRAKGAVGAVVKAGLTVRIINSSFMD